MSSMTKYVEEYLKLDKRAVDAEEKVERYKKIAEDDRWEQCRIVWEAVEGDWSFTSFGREVGKSRQHISRQASAWEKYGRTGRCDRTSYTEAYEEAKGSPNNPKERSDQRIEQGARKLPPEKKAKLFEEMRQDPEVQKRASEARKEAGKDNPNSTPNQLRGLEKHIEAANFVSDAKIAAEKFMEAADQLTAHQKKDLRDSIEAVIDAWSGILGMVDNDADEWLKGITNSNE